MPMTTRQARGGRAFAFPVFGIAVLLVSYLLLVQWQEVPAIIGAALAAVHWPT